MVSPLRPATEATVTVVRRDAAELPTLTIEARTAAGVVSAPLGLQPVTVGSADECDLVVSSERVSRAHCRISLDTQGIRVSDLGSKNGTRVGGIAVLDAYVPLEVPVMLGDVALVVRSEGSPIVTRLSTLPRFGEALGESVAMRALFALLERVAPTDETLLLIGESGTGKELLARAVHDASPRKDGPFVVADLSAVTPSLVEAELFGHVRGAFTGAVADREGLFEQANGGTLFLDEIGELPLELQPKLLRAIEGRQTRRVGATQWKDLDLRIVAATHAELRAKVKSGAFRGDLYYRLAVVEARVPPLRERPSDVELLVERFLATQQPPRALSELPAGTLEMLRSHQWPGNVRELRNTVTRLMLFPDLGKRALDVMEASPGGSGELEALMSLRLRDARERVVEEFEKRYVQAQLAAHDGNVSRAAEAMGISRQFAHRLIERLGLR